MLWQVIHTLAECSIRFNICNILQTKLILDLLQIVIEDDYNKLIHDPHLDYQNDGEDLEIYKSTWRFIRRGSYYDIQKTLTDLKPLFVDGAHIDPSLYVEKLNQEDGSFRFKIKTDAELIYVTEQEKSMMTDQEQTLINTVNKIDQSKAIVIPIMILVDEESHKSFCKSSSSYRHDTKEEFNQKFMYYRRIQDYLEQQSKDIFYQVKVDASNPQKTVEEVCDIINRHLTESKSITIDRAVE